MVVARQRPATAGGIVFLLLEDETGPINVIVRPGLYESHRAVVRADPLLVVRGRLERRERVAQELEHHWLLGPSTGAQQLIEHLWRAVALKLHVQ